MHAGIHPPRQTPPLGRRPPLRRQPPRQTPPLHILPLGRHSPADTPLGRHHLGRYIILGRHPLADTTLPPADAPVETPSPSLETATAADGTRPTGMISCFLRFFLGSLQSGNLWKLAQRITNEEELRELGSALKIHDYKLDTALANATNIQLAAYRILQTWSKGFESSKEAQTTLLKSLKQCGMNKLAALLK